MKIKEFKFNQREKEYLDKYQSIFCANYKNISSLKARIDILNLDYKDISKEELVNQINTSIKESFIFEKTNLGEYSINKEYKTALINYSDFYYSKLSFKFPTESSFNSLKYSNNLIFSSGEDGLIRIFKFDEKNNTVYFIKEIGKRGEICSAFEIYKNYLLYAIDKDLYVYNFKSEKLIKTNNISEKIYEINFDTLNKNLSLYFGKKRQEFDVIDGEIYFTNDIKEIIEEIERKYNSISINKNTKIICNDNIFYYKILNKEKILFEEIYFSQNRNIILSKNKNNLLLFINENNNLELINTINESILAFSENNKYLLSKKQFLQTSEINFYQYDIDKKKFINSNITSLLNDFYSFSFSKDSEFLFYIVKNQYYLKKIKDLITDNRIIDTNIMTSTSKFLKCFFSEKSKTLVIVFDTTFLNTYLKIVIFNINDKKIVKEFELNISTFACYFLNNEEIIVFLYFSEKTKEKILDFYDNNNFKLLKTMTLDKDSESYKINENSFITKNKTGFDIFSLENDFYTSGNLKKTISIEIDINTKIFFNTSEKILCATNDKLYIYSINSKNYIPLIINTSNLIKDFCLYNDSKNIIIFYLDSYEMYNIENLDNNKNTISRNPCRKLLGYKKFDNYISIIYTDEIKTFKHTNNGAKFIYNIKATTTDGDYEKIPENMFAFDNGFIIKKENGKVYGSDNWKDYVYFIDGDEIKDYPKWESYFDAVWDSNIFEEL